MTVASGREFLMIPGPTTVPDEVLRGAGRGHRERHPDLRGVFRTDGRVYVYAATGHGAWEAALSNVLSRGERVLVLESGLFARAWGDMAAVLGVEVEVLPGAPRRGS